MYARLNDLSEKMTRDLTENILPFWLNRTADRENGGFYGEMTRDGTVIKNADKGLILNARILWTFSAAYRVLKNDAYLAAADRAFNYLLNRFWDMENGGCFYMLNYKGGVVNPMKSTYAQGFALYAFSEYYRATGSKEALAYSEKIFDYIENNCKHDGGYAETASGSAFDKKKNVILPEHPLAGYDFQKLFTMNTHLHILEPVTNYFRINPSPKAEKALINLIELFLTKIYDRNTRHFNQFFTDDWTPVTTTASYGHDIEGAWLLNEAGETLLACGSGKERYEKLFTDCKTCAADMAEAVLIEGTAIDTGAILEEGDKNGKILCSRKVWWAQAEGIVGFVNAWELKGRGKFLEAAEALWTYINGHIIDHVGGEWFATGTDSPEDENTGYKVNAWKCPYHNARAAMEIFERAGKYR